MAGVKDCQPGVHTTEADGIRAQVTPWTKDQGMDLDLALDCNSSSFLAVEASGHAAAASSQLIRGKHSRPSLLLQRATLTKPLKATHCMMHFQCLHGVHCFPAARLHTLDETLERIAHGSNGKACSACSKPTRGNQVQKNVLHLFIESFMCFIIYYSSIPELQKHLTNPSNISKCIIKPWTLRHQLLNTMHRLSKSRLFQTYHVFQCLNPARRGGSI